VAFELARVLFDAGSVSKALDASARAILLAPEDPRPTILRARAFAAAGNWYQSIRILSALLARAPDSREAWLVKARIQADDAHDADGALATLAGARSRFPQDASLAELAGRVLMDAGRQDQALDALRQALDIEPDRVSALRLLLKDAVRTRRWIPARDYVTRILARDPTPDDLSEAYRISWNLDDFVQAAAYARSLLAARPGSASRLLLARALHAQGDDVQTAALIETGLKGGPPPADVSGFLTLRASLEAARDQEAALKDLRMALVADPDNRDALLAISDLLTARRDYRRAMNYLKHAASLAPDEPGLQVQIQQLEKQAESEE
jgi:tetratricopeptide (TPR) repeat protein